MIARFVDIGGIVDHHCLGEILRYIKCLYCTIKPNLVQSDYDVGYLLLEYLLAKTFIH